MNRIVPWTEKMMKPIHRILHRIRGRGLRGRDAAIAERDEIVRQRDVAIGERNELLRQRDEVIFKSRIDAERFLCHLHRAEMTARRGTIALRAGRADPVFLPMAASRDRLLVHLHLSRTGGVTLRDILRRNFSTGDYLALDGTHLNTSVLGTWSNLDVERSLGKLRPGEVDRIRAVWGYFRHGVHDVLPKRARM